jgi:hypothetical protein
MVVVMAVMAEALHLRFQAKGRCRGLSNSLSALRIAMPADPAPPLPRLTAADEGQGTGGWSRPAMVTRYWFASASLAGV